MKTPNKNTSISFREMNSINSEENAYILTPIEVFVKFVTKWLTNETFIKILERDCRIALIQIVMLT